jgi:hypothetical protein
MRQQRLHRTVRPVEKLMTPAYLERRVDDHEELFAIRRCEYHALLTANFPSLSALTVKYPAPANPGENFGLDRRSIVMPI